MIRAASLSIAQLADPAIVRVLLLSALATLALFAIAAAGLSYVLDGVDPCDALGLDSCAFGPGASGFAALLLAALGLWFLFPAVAIGIVGLFSESVVSAVEARHYPAALAVARHPGIGEQALLGLGSGLRLLVYNLLALPFYLLLIVTGVGPLLLFLAVNAAALGRDLREMVAVRHLDRPARGADLARSRGDRWLLGLFVSALFLVPFVNLLAPVLGAAMATHRFHGLR